MWQGGSSSSNKAGPRQRGKLAGGQAPKGQLCASQNFTFTQQYGPYTSCGHLKAPVSAGFVSADGVSRSEALLTSIEVKGCSAAAAKAKMRVKVPAAAMAAATTTTTSSRMRVAHKAPIDAAPIEQAADASIEGGHEVLPPAARRGSSCVRQPWFWKHCMLPTLPGDPACDVIMTALPGGQGPRTPFFPYRKAPQVKRTYRQLMVMPKKTGNVIVDLHFQAAKVFIAAQLNHLSGVTMPEAVSQAYVLLGRDYFSVYDDRSASVELVSRPKVLEQVAAAAKVLADFTSGRYPQLPTCAAALEEQHKQHKQGQQAKRSVD